VVLLAGVGDAVLAAAAAGWSGGDAACELAVTPWSGD